MATFALVHGAWHGAWCWERLSPLLQQAGHDVVTMDLPSEDGTATFDTYADVVCAALAGRDDDVVLVGHSYGGNTVPLVAARRPVRHLVYLCAMIPDVGRSLFDQIGDELEMLNPLYEQGLSIPDEQLRQVWADLDIARSMFYGDCDEPTTEAAIDRLRPQSAFPAIQPSSLSEHPSVPTTYIVCSEDRILRPAWSRHTARERLDADLVELPGDHSPFYSRPAVLAEVLLGLT
ncbi:MAG TPA: alpha/beta fold hydrolase [Mycobacterium sp.]|jgi:pimeloyl-ACP methyl ester carboxylesterase|nr:alpha/beta fold hydrolase [Mycobacterium sp.]